MNWKIYYNKLKNIPLPGGIYLHLVIWFLFIFGGINTEVTMDGFDDGIPDSFIEGNFGYDILINLLVFYYNFMVLMPKYLSNRLGIYSIKIVGLISIFSLLETSFDWMLLNYLHPDTQPQAILVLLAINLVCHTFILMISIVTRLGINRFINSHLEKQLKIEHTEAELAFLKSQVQPHFLFNMLNTLYSSAYSFGDAETAEGIGKLSHLLRYMLYETQDEKVPLENEVEYLQNYIDLQEMRFLDDVAVDFRVEGEITDITIAPMMLIALIENAFKHGISPTKKAEIKVSLTVTPQQIILQVENDIRRKKPKPEVEAGGIGLENLKRRLSLLYPDQYRLTILEKNKRFIATLELE